MKKHELVVEAALLYEFQRLRRPCLSNPLGKWLLPEGLCLTLIAGTWRPWFWCVEHTLRIHSVLYCNN